jgi:hypothetical protein
MNKFWDSNIENGGEFVFEANKEKLIKNLDMLSEMPVEEQTLYKKWQEFNSDLHSSMMKLPSLQQHYDKIWKPTDIFNKELTISEIQNMQPYVELVDDVSKWTEVRKLISSMEFTANPGRNLKAFVKDRTSGKILGVISLGSDVVSVKVRDEFIGWTKEDKFKKGKLNCIAMGTSIVPTQPLGFNFLGGKLIAALTTSPTFRNKWKEQYDDIMVAMHTTALYGASSQYNGIPHMKTLGESAGKIGTKPDNWIYKIWHDYIKEKYPEKYEKAINATGPKQNIINLILKELQISPTKYHHGFQRGIYFAQMYENGNDYLCNKITEEELILKPKFVEGDDYTIRWWKDKAIKRYTKLYEEDRIKPESLFYIDLIGMTWEDCRKKYLKEVGR